MTACEVLLLQGPFPQAQLDQMEFDLREARIVLLRLQKDRDGITKLLRDNVRRQEERQQRMDRLTEGGYASADASGNAHLRVLAARLRLATHLRDEEQQEVVLKEAVEIEEEKLSRLTRLASRGYVSTGTVAAQKLRIAKLIVDREIQLPEAP